MRALVQRVHFDDTNAIVESLPPGDPNARSLAAKVAVANRYHIGTIGFWYIGHQSPKVWPVLRSFNG